MQKKETLSERNKRELLDPLVRRKIYRNKVFIVAAIVIYCVAMPTELYLRSVFGFDEGIGGILVAFGSLALGVLIGEYKAKKKFGISNA